MIESPGKMLWSPQAHIPALDGVRGIAILLVTFFRFGRDAATQMGVDSRLEPFLRIGERGVDLFFVLSGFLITGILLDAVGRQHFFLNFYWRRTLRIFPLYYAAILLCLFVIPHWAADSAKFDLAYGQQFYLWTYLANLKMSLVNEWCFGAMDHFWSLAVEEHFYLLWPFVVYFLRPTTLFRYCLALAFISFSLRTTCLVWTEQRVAADVFSFFRMEGLCLGSALAAWIRHSHSSSIASARSRGFWCLIGTCFLTITLAVSGKSVFAIGHTLGAIVWALALMLLVTSSPSSIVARLVSVSALRHFGKYSYAMYVFQNPLMVLFGGYVSVSWIAAAFRLPPPLSGLVYFCALFALTWLVALLSWLLLEKHFLRLRDWNELENMNHYLQRMYQICRLKY